MQFTEREGVTALDLTLDGPPREIGSQGRVGASAIMARLFEGEMCCALIHKQERFNGRRSISRIASRYQIACGSWAHEPY
jgi:hypothetical protein